jgi:hypothetical protein
MKILTDMAAFYALKLSCIQFRSTVFWDVTLCSLVDHYHRQDKRMKVTAACSSETSATIHQTIRRHTIKEINLHSSRPENLKPRMYACGHY